MTLSCLVLQFWLPCMNKVLVSWFLFVTWQSILTKISSNKQFLLWLLNNDDKNCFFFYVLSWNFIWSSCTNLASVALTVKKWVTRGKKYQWIINFFSLSHIYLRNFKLMLRTNYLTWTLEILIQKTSNNMLQEEKKKKS